MKFFTTFSCSSSHSSSNFEIFLFSNKISSFFVLINLTFLYMTFLFLSLNYFILYLICNFLFIFVIKKPPEGGLYFRSNISFLSIFHYFSMYLFYKVRQKFLSYVSHLSDVQYNLECKFLIYEY